jgi:hypothetical protein
MTLTKSGSMVFFLVLVLLAGAVLLLARAPAAMPPTWSAIALPRQQAAVHQAARSGATLNGLDLDVGGAEGHAVAQHGDVARRILEAARAGRCTTIYLECGADPRRPADGTKGYMVCPLAGGGLGLVPFYVDALVGRLVAMTAFVVRPGYERYVAQRDGCVPIGTVILLEEDYAADSSTK